MAHYRDSGEVKSRISQLFKNDLGFTKSANLAGEMVTRHWRDCQGDNYEKHTLSILVASANALFDPIPNENELSVYLWCYQKVHEKRGWFFSIKTSWDDRYKASKWFMEKARHFAQQTGQRESLNTLPLLEIYTATIEISRVILFAN
jgi:hypothetical protein